MRFIKTISAIAFALGVILIIGAAGTNDMMNELQQPHSVNWLQVIGGLLLMLPLPIVNMKKGN